MAESTTGQRGRVARNVAQADTLPENWQAAVGAELSRQLQALEPDPGEIGESPADRVASLLGSAGDDERASVKLYRLDAKNNLEFCASYSVTDFETRGLDGVRADWGAGKYQIRLYATDPASRKYVVRARTDISIAPMASTALVQASGGSELARVLETMATQQQKLLEAVTHRPDPVDPMVQMTQMFSMMKLMREAMGMDSAPQQKSSIGEIVSAIKELRGAAAEVLPKEEKESDNLLSLAGPVMDIVKTAMGNQRPATVAPLQIPSSIQGAEEHAPNPIATPDVDLDDPDMLEILLMKANLKKLLQMAAAKVSIDDGVDFVLEKLPDALVDNLRQDAWFELLSTFAPQAGEFREWLTQVRDAVVSELDAEGDGPETKTGPGAVS